MTRRRTVANHSRSSTASGLFSLAPAVVLSVYPGLEEGLLRRKGTSSIHEILEPIRFTSVLAIPHDRGQI